MIPIFILIEIIVLCLNIVLAWIYIVPIIIHRRFHNLNNIFTGNLSFAICCCSIAWLMGFLIDFTALSTYNSKVICALISYYQTVCTLQVPLAIVQGSIHQLLSIVYHRKNFIKNHFYAALVVILQWLSAYILAIPFVFVDFSVRKLLDLIHFIGEIFHHRFAIKNDGRESMLYSVL